MDEGTNFLSVKKGQIILILIFSLLFKANYEECMAPPPAKKARDDKTAPSVPAPMQPGFKLKREWTASYNMVNPAEAMQDHEIAGPVAQEHSDATPSTLQHTLPGPGPVAQEHSDATGPSTLQHALPGPSGTQAQTDYANVSIFSYLSISSFFSLFQSQYKNISVRY